MATETASKIETCSACRFWKTTDQMNGECRRRAPQAVVFNVTNETRFQTQFPETAKEDWCGEFQAKG